MRSALDGSELSIAAWYAALAPFLAAIGGDGGAPVSPYGASGARALKGVAGAYGGGNRFIGWAPMTLLASLRAATFCPERSAQPLVAGDEVGWVGGAPGA